MSNQYIDDRISVIIPVYNSAKYIEKTLQSVFEQSYDDIEIILVDDCSTDNSADIISQYKRFHPEIVSFTQSQNYGAGVARNKALEIATGRYVAFLDADDLWMPQKTKKQLQLMKEKQVPFAYSAIEMIDENGNVIKKKRKIRESCDYNYLLHNTIIATSSVMVDRKIYGDFRMSLRRGGQDYATWLMLLRDGKIACGNNEVLVQYRIVKKSLSSNKLQSVKQVWEIQTQDEKINKISAAFNVGGFCLNALKKYIL